MYILTVGGDGQSSLEVANLFVIFAPHIRYFWGWVGLGWGDFLPLTVVTCWLGRGGDGVHRQGRGGSDPCLQNQS